MRNKTLKFLTCAAAAVVMTISSGMALTVSADWKESSSGYSYINESGKKMTGWATIDGEKYYFSKKGIAVTGFKEIKGKTYYFIKTEKGRMATGWYKVGSKKYYFGKDGAMRKGWKTIGGKRYYFDKDGSMITGSVTINGKKYSFGTDGVLIEGTSSTGLKNVKLGMSQDRVIKAAGLKNHSAFELGGGNSGVIAYKTDFYGVNCDAILIFDEDDKLIGVCAYSENHSSFSKWKSSFKKTYKFSKTADELIKELKQTLAAYGISVSSTEDMFKLLEAQGVDTSAFKMMDEYNIILYSNDAAMTSGDIGIVMENDGYVMSMMTDKDNLTLISDMIKALGKVYGENVG